MKLLHQCDQCSGWAFRHSTEPCPNCKLPAQKHALRAIIAVAFFVSLAPLWVPFLIYLFR